MSNCHHCGVEITGKFCQNCARPTTLKRIDAHYIKHEIEHLLHFEKGFFYTVRELALRPGKTVRKFLFEDRKRLVKPIIFIIVTSLIYSLINNFFHVEDQYVQFESGKYGTMGKMLKWVQEHYGYSNILMSVFIAFFLKIMFRKQQYNFYEIIVLLCYLLGIGMLIFSVSIFIEGIIQQKISAFLGMLGMIYIVWGIGNFYNPRKFSSYLKATFAYLLGAGAMFLILIFTGIMIDRFILH